MQWISKGYITGREAQFDQKVSGIAINALQNTLLSYAYWHGKFSQ